MSLLLVALAAAVAWYLCECASKETQTRALWAAAGALALYVAMNS